MDVRIVSGSQNQGAIVAADVRSLPRANAQVFVQVNVSGDIVNPASGGGVGSSVNVSQINGQTPDIGSGNAGTGTLRVMIASDQGTIPISGNITTTPSPVPVTGVQIVGGAVGAQVAPSGDFPVRIAGATAPVGVTGDVSTVPKAGQTWPVREQAVTGVQIVGGGVGGTFAASGDLAVVPSSTSNSRFPVSGDVVLRDGVNNTRSTVRAYANSNPVAVVLTNVSGDTYSPAPKEPILISRSGRMSNTGDFILAGPYAGRTIKVVSYDLQSEGDTAQGYFASNPSGEQLSLQWQLGNREGVAKQVPSAGGGYIFKTQAGHQLVFEMSGVPMRYSVTFHTGDSF